ncbi:MAG: NTPase KAP, partial [Variovorax sp.]|nr:NTPase KAP [Variovorax sp.]
MSLQTTKGHLIRLLSDSENRVLALSGRWGTGKSHLWKQVKEASADEAVKSALYVSLFGLADMDQVKLKIVQSAL